MPRERQKAGGRGPRLFLCLGDLPGRYEGNDDLRGYDQFLFGAASRHLNRHRPVGIVNDHRWPACGRGVAGGRLRRGDWSDAGAAAAKAQAVRTAKPGNRKFDRVIFFDLDYGRPDRDARMKKRAGLSARALPSVSRPRRGLFPRLFVCAAVFDGGGFVRRGV